MNFLCILKNIANMLQSKQKKLFTYDVNKQKKYIARFREPIDDIERSFFQYKCQMKMKGIGFTILLNIFSFFMIIYYLNKLKEYTDKTKCNQIHAIFFDNGIPHNVVPNELLVEFKNIGYANNEDALNLNKEDRKFIYNLIRRYPLSYHFIFKCLLKVAMYSSRLSRNNLKAFIVCSEYSFTSSVLTKYCEINKVQHINIMHGEKLFYMNDSFFHFNRCYIWENHYRKLFINLRAEPNQFIVAVPKSLKFGDNTLVEKEYDFTYYLADECKDEMIIINKSLKKLSDKGHKIAIRPHPRYTDLKLAYNIFKDYDIENNKQITIENSILRTKNAISLYSTVLNQAYLNGVGVLIDDVKNYDNYCKLSELGYVRINEEHKVLSKIL